MRLIEPVRSIDDHPRCHRLMAQLGLGLLLIAGLELAVATDHQAVTVLTGAHLIDGTGVSAVADAVVVISGQRIACAGRREDCPVPEGADVVDLDGYWLMPGLVDAHVHFSQTGFYDGRPDAEDLRARFPYEQVQARQRREPSRYLDSYLCAGITGVFDVGGFNWSVDLARQDNTQAQRPEIAASGPLVTHWVPEIVNLRSEKLMLSLDSEADGRRAVREMVALGADAVKVWFLPVRDSDQRSAIDARVLAMGEEAAAHEIPLIVHATGLREAKVALRAGARMLVHSVDDAEVDEEFLQLALENDVIYVPTLIVSRGYLNIRRAFAGARAFEIDDPHGCVDTHTRLLLEKVADYGSGAGQPGTEAALGRMERRISATERIMASNLRKVFDAGITVAAGSDAGNPGTLHGIALQAELEAMQAAGLSADEIIVMATRNGARAMRREADFGTVVAGRLANLVILGANPAEDVANLRDLRRVMVRGEFVR